MHWSGQVCSLPTELLRIICSIDTFSGHSYWQWPVMVTVTSCDWSTAGHVTPVLSSDWSPSTGHQSQVQSLIPQCLNTIYSILRVNCLVTEWEDTSRTLFWMMHGTVGYKQWSSVPTSTLNYLIHFHHRGCNNCLVMMHGNCIAFCKLWKMFIFLSFYISIQSQPAAETLGSRSVSRQGAAVKRDDSRDVNGTLQNTVLWEGRHEGPFFVEST